MGAQQYGSNGESKAFTRNREAEYFALSTEDLYFPTLFRIIYTEIITISEISLKVYIHTDVYFNVRNLGTYKKNDPWGHTMAPREDVTWAKKGEGKERLQLARNDSLAQPML